MVLVGAACGPAVAEEPASESTSTTESTTTSSSSTTLPQPTASSTTSDPSTSSTTAPDPDTSSSGTGSADSTGDSTGGVPSVCDPQPQEVRTAINANPESESIEYDVDENCTVQSVEMVDASRQRIELLCGEALDSAQVLEVSSNPFVDVGLAPNQEVGLRIAESVPIDYGGYEYVAIRDVEGELIAAMYGDIESPPEIDEPAWFAPFTFVLRTDVCELEPYEPPMGGSFIQDPCSTQDQRAAFELTVQDESVLVHDATIGALAGYEIHVPIAQMRFPQEGPDCPAGPYAIGRFVILREPL